MRIQILLRIVRRTVELKFVLFFWQLTWRAMAVAQFSQFFLLSPRGDSILFKDFRGELPKSTAEVFFRNVKFYGGKVQEAPPVFNIDGVNFIYVKTHGLLFVLTSL